jgi:peptidoglycan/LPS O-acetylase OafA/YrhL
MLFAVILLWFFKAKNKIFVVFVFCSLLALILVGGRMVALQSKFGVLRGMYGFFIGCLIYSLYRARPQLLAKLNATAGVLPVSFCVAGLFALMWFIHALPLWVFYVFPPVFGVMLFLLIEPTRPILRFLQSPPLLMLGTLSYSIYMINFPVKLAVGLVLVRMGATYEHSEDIVISPWAGDLLVLCFVAAVLALSWLSYYYYEHPMRLLLGSKRRRAQSTEPGPVRQAL